MIQPSDVMKNVNSFKLSSDNTPNEKQHIITHKGIIQTSLFCILQCLFQFPFQYIDINYRVIFKNNVNYFIDLSFNLDLEIRRLIGVLGYN